MASDSLRRFIDRKFEIDYGDLEEVDRMLDEWVSELDATDPRTRSFEAGIKSERFKRVVLDPITDMVDRIEDAEEVKDLPEDEVSAIGMDSFRLPVQERIEGKKEEIQENTFEEITKSRAKPENIEKLIRRELKEEDITREQAEELRGVVEERKEKRALRQELSSEIFRATTAEDIRNIIQRGIDAELSRAQMDSLRRAQSQRLEDITG